MSSAEPILESDGEVDVESEVIDAESSTVPTPVLAVSVKPKRPHAKRRPQKLHSLDRRILKAFYTQYVAVLLIVLTFTVGSFQRTMNVVSEPPTAPMPQMAAEAPPIGAISLTGLFNEIGRMEGEQPKLDAVAQVVSNHDIDARITLSVPRLSLASDSVPFVRAYRRLAQIEQYLIEQGAPAEAIVLEAIDGPEGTPITIQFSHSQPVKR